MHYFGLALLVLVVQPLPPLPRQPINEKAEKANQEHAIANQSKGTADQPTPARTRAGCDANTYNTYNFATDPNAEPTNQSERWSRTDRLTAFYDGLTGLLVLVAAGTGWVIWKQTIETRKAADAALKNADAMIASERAWLTATVESFGEPLAGTKMIWIEVPIKNHGRTPARVKKDTSTSKLISFSESISRRPGQLPEVPEYEPERTIELQDRDLIIAPGDTLRHMHVFIFPAEWIRIKERQKSLYVYGFVEYSDTVKGALHRNCFCSIYWVPEQGYNEPTGFMFSQFIPEAY